MDVDDELLSIEGSPPAADDSRISLLVTRFGLAR